MRRSLSACISLALTSAVFSQTMPSTQPTTDPAAAGAVKDALAAYNKAVDAADVKTLVGSVHVSSDLQKQALALMSKLTLSGRALYDSSVAIYGADELAKDNVTKTSFPAGYPQLMGDGMTVKVEGDKATLSSPTPDGPPALSMVKKDDAWKIDGDALLPAMNAKQLGDQSMIINAAIAAIDDVTADVKAGKFRGADEAIVVMNLRVQKGVRAAQAKIVPVPDAATAPATGPTGPTTEPATMP